MTLASILDISGNYGLSDYMKEVFEESKRDEVEDEAENEEENESKDEETTTEVEDKEEVVPENEQVEKKAEVQGEPKETEAVINESGSGDKFFNAVDEENNVDEGVTTLAAQPVKQKVKSTSRGVDSSGSIPDYDLLHIQAEFDRALKANA
ncbi:hypothetical protein Dimus_003548 [Dionaea muscipula]